MLSSKQYETIGRLTIGFNEIEFLVEIYIVNFLGATEFAIGEMIASREKFFRHRTDLLEAILKVIADQYKFLSPQVSAVQNYISQARRLADKRNGIVHGLLIPDNRSGRPSLRFKNKDVVWDEAALEKLLTDLSKLTDDLSDACYALKEVVDETRIGK
jgi:hypothetical protein